MSRPLPALALALVLSFVPASGRRARAEQPPPFTEEAAASGLDFVHFNGMSGELYFLENMGPGVGLLDYDGDGDLDVYAVQGHMLGPGKTVDDAPIPPAHPLPLSDRLYRNDLRVGPDGTRTARFTDVTESSGLADLATGYGMGVATGDADGDGRLDLYLTNFGPNQMLRNRGDGTFEDVTAASGAGDSQWSVSSTFVDYDLDHDLDLYVANYTDFSFANHHDCFTSSGAIDYCGPLNYRPVPDRLLRNRGDGTFEDVSATSGVQALEGNGLGVVAADIDGDGLPDLYVANDQVPNFLWMNLGGGKLREDALLAGCAVNREGDAEASMGVAAEDLDGDGDLDLFMAHLREETNTLFVNEGRGLFRDGTVGSGLGPPSLPYTAFGTAFLDYDADGDLDLVVVNGAVTLIEDLRQAGDPHPLHQPNQLFENRGGLRFEEVSERAGPAFELSEVSRGLAVGDVDGDLDPDLLIANNAGPARLLINRVVHQRHRLGVEVMDDHHPAFGAVIEVLTPEGVSPGRVRTDGSYASVNDHRVLLGLGEESRPVAIRVRWQGRVREVRGLPPDRLVRIDLAADPDVEEGPP